MTDIHHAQQSNRWESTSDSGHIISQDNDNRMLVAQTRRFIFGSA